MEQPQQATDPSRAGPEPGWIVVAPICFTGLGAMIVVHTASR